MISALHFRSGNTIDMWGHLKGRDTSPPVKTCRWLLTEERRLLTPELCHTHIGGGAVKRWWAIVLWKGSMAS